MIQESVECKRIGNEYVDLFRKLLQYIHYTKLSTDFITDDDLKMLSELDFYISSGKYEIIEFGTRKSPFDVREKLEELEKKNKTFEDYNKDLNNQLDKIEKENKRLELENEKHKSWVNVLNKDNHKFRDKIEQLEEDLEAEKSTSSNLARRINKAIEYLENTDLGILEFWKVKEILKGEENEN